ncbi:hypothetical protein [Phytoactinopolyspora alkaliphila]|nr:hypothetical protein [Phytoactinopolyspora alkaliphila]
MLMTYDHFNTDELRGTSQADYLISIDADFRIQDGDTLVYKEPSFPIVELARSLLIWMNNPDRGDFAFDSMAFEEVGSVQVRQALAGWTFSSVFAPRSPSAPVEWSEVERCVRDFVAQVERDLAAFGLDPDEVIRR